MQINFSSVQYHLHSAAAGVHCCRYSWDAICFCFVHDSDSFLFTVWCQQPTSFILCL